MARRIRRISQFVISVSAILLLFLSACGPPQNETAPTSADNTTGQKPPVEGVDLPPAPQPDKGNPTLDSFLNQLIQAEQRGEAEAFARQRNVELVDGKVRVEIGAAPGQLDVAANVTASIGTVEIVSRRLNGIQALVPITSLTILAKEKSILYIRQPVASAQG